MVYEKISPCMSSKKWKMCVIGAGPAGLVSARELRREGHSVVVMEQNHDLGGTWLYDPRAEMDDPLGSNLRRKVHSSIYSSLRLISSRETMGFSDYPFIVKEGRDERRFPGHKELWLYLKDFAHHFNLVPLIRFNSRVEYVGMVHEGKEVSSAEGDGTFGLNVQWVVRSRMANLEGFPDHDNEEGEAVEEVFDGVVVCSGHYSQPRIPQIPGMQTWQGKQIHSHNYRVPDPFCNEVVVVIGNSPSGQDISLELLSVSKEVHLSSKSLYLTDGLKKIQANYQNFHIHSVVVSLSENGIVTFQDGSSVFADAIIYCTGYSYSFPFLNTRGMVKVDDDRVGPLYEHIFPPFLSPSLSFIGIPRKVIGFPFFESQARWLAQILSGKTILPSVKDMNKSVEDFYKQKDAAGLPKHLTHDICDFEYCDWLADQSGFPHLEEWKKEITLATIRNAESNLETFRDSWDDKFWLDIALST